MKESARRAVHLLLPILVSVLHLRVVNYLYPFVGSDYRYFLPRMLDTHLYYLLNGLEIQWWTPTFGGGLPSYHNPQQMQFSLTQLLLFIVDPWTAVNITIVIAICIGWHACYVLLRHYMACDTHSALLGAVLFTASGFLAQRALVGHVGYLAFPLVAVVALQLPRLKHRFLEPCIIAALCLTYLLYSAGFYLFLVFLLSSAMVWFIARISTPGPPAVSRARVLAAIALVGGIVLLLSLSKVFAVFSFMGEFPRERTRFYSGGYLTGLVGVVMQLFYFGACVLWNSMDYAQNHLRACWADLRIYTGAWYRPWELDVGMSLAAVLALGVGMWRLRAKNGRETIMLLLRKRNFELIVLFILGWFTVEVSMAKGPLFFLYSQLPLVESMHVFVRNVSAFILPLSIISAVILCRSVPTQVTRAWLAYGLIAVALIQLIALGPISDVYSAVHSSGRKWKFKETDATIFLSTYEAVVANSRASAIRTVGNITDNLALLHRESSLGVYETLFTFGLKKFHPQVSPGPVDRIDDGRFNITHPASLVYPDRYGMEHFDRIPVSDAENFRRFVSHRSTDWPIPIAQRVANWVSLVALLLSLGWVLSSRTLAGYRALQGKRISSRGTPPQA